jgi:hypothetical protein
MQPVFIVVRHVDEPGVVGLVARLSRPRGPIIATARNAQAWLLLRSEASPREHSSVEDV